MAPARIAAEVGTAAKTARSRIDPLKLPRHQREFYVSVNWFTVYKPKRDIIIHQLPKHKVRLGQ